MKRDENSTNPSSLMNLARAVREGFLAAGKPANPWRVVTFRGPVVSIPASGRADSLIRSAPGVFPEATAARQERDGSFRRLAVASGLFVLSASSLADPLFDASDGETPAFLIGGRRACDFFRSDRSKQRANHTECSDAWKAMRGRNHYRNPMGRFPLSPGALLLRPKNVGASPCVHRVLSLSGVARVVDPPVRLWRSPSKRVGKGP